MDFGDKVKKERLKRKLTQQDAVKAINDEYKVKLTAAELSRIERIKDATYTYDPNIEAALVYFFNIIIKADSSSENGSPIPIDNKQKKAKKPTEVKHNPFIAIKKEGA